MKTSTEQPSCKWNLQWLFILICTTLVSTISFGQAGNAPMQQLPPFPGLFAIDGYLQRQGVNGDWLQAAGGSANNFIFTDAGQPAPGIMFSFLKRDLFNDQTNDEIFDGGNKLNDNPNDWGWRSQKPPAKDDIHNAAGWVAINPADNHIWLAISGDRLSTNGTSYIDFEFYQNEITRTGGPIPGGTGGFITNGPHNGRTVGDLSLTLEFTSGGSFATVKYLQWQPTGEAGGYDYFPLNPPAGTAFAAANDDVAPINVPYGAFGGTTYSRLQFVEGAVDLTALIGGTGAPGECGSQPFESLFIKTKSSASSTADLKDFIAPFSLNTCFDETPPVIICPPTLNLQGCNPTVPGPSFVGGTATDNCNGTIIPVAADGPITSTACGRRMNRTWIAMDGCGNMSSCIQEINWTVDNTPPIITSGGTTTTLGCSPSAGDINGALGTATGSDACGTPTVSAPSDGAVTSNGCARSQTRTWTAVDACGNTASASRTVTWTLDNTAPAFTGTYNDVTLTCNIAEWVGSLGTATATDACSTPTITSSDGPVVSNDCNRSITRTFTARDGCNNTATISRTVRWIAVLTNPILTVGGQAIIGTTEFNLGCNPPEVDINTTLGTANATNGCANVSVNAVDAPIVTNGCERVRVRTFTATDDCGHLVTAARLVRWIVSNVGGPQINPNTAPTVLGCNPSENDINAALGTVTATDACANVTITSSDGPTESVGCSRARTRTFTATGGCGNTATASRTVTWTADLTAPTITATGGSLTLGCNPTTGDINGALGSASATDACGNPTVSSSDGAVTSTGCARSQTRTFTARDACGNTSTTSRTATWTADVTAPTITATGASLTLGCNPTTGDINGALGSASATDACGNPTVTPSDGAVTSTGCARSQTRTFTARDACGNTSTTSRTATWTADVTAPTITATGASLTLGCNPTTGDINGALGSASATDACGNPTVTPSDGAVTSTGCARSQTRTFTARDACGNTSTTSRTATWTADVTAPTITATGASLTLGCNPTTGDINGALGSASATDACGNPTVTPSDGAVTSTGCARSQTRTFTARDACGNTSTTSRTATWTADVTAPTITATGASLTLGCNPTTGDINGALGSASATDACGNPTVTPSDGAVTSTGCARSQTRTFTARDACGNTSTTSRTATWTADVTAPTITATGASLTLGCNPTTGDINGALGSASATDACGNPTVTPSDGAVTSTGCARSQTRTFTARDACGNTSTTSRTATWTADVTAPTITATGASLTLGCNPTTGDINGALGSASATDACGNPTVTPSDGAVTSTGCARSQTRTFTARDACGNTSTTSRTATWTADVTAPTITATGASLTLGCNPTTGDINGALGSASATDACGNPTVTPSDGAVTSTGCARSQTRTFTARDACGNTSTTSRTATWTADVTAPTITATGASLTLGCNPTTGDINGALGSASATDACGNPTVTPSDGAVTSTGCARSQTRTFTAIDACGNTSTTSRTATWTADVTAPTITATGASLTLGCNPTTGDINGALGSASATDACGNPTVTPSDGAVTSTGCARSQTRTWTARDACGNTSTASRTVTWTSDNTAPVFTTTPASVDVDCSAPVPSSVAPTASDACGTPTVTMTGSTDNPANCTTGFNRIVTRTWTARDACGNTATYTQTIRVKCCETVCTLTQGAYGNPGGNICLPNGTTVNQTQIMINALTAAPGNMVVFGRQDLNKYWVVRLSDVNAGPTSNIFKMLPGGGPSAAFGTDNVAGVPEYSNGPSWPVVPLQQDGSIRNQLFSQTLTLYFNTTIAGSTLANVSLNGLAVIAPRNCGSSEPAGAGVPTQLVSPAISSYLATHGYAVTVAGLLQLANDALGGVNVSPLTLSQIQEAVNNINEAFDECKILTGYVPAGSGSGRVVTSNSISSQPSLTVTAFPNPYEENFSLKINSPVTGQAMISFYTMSGVKIGEMKRDVVALKDVWVPYNVPAVYRTRIVYTVNIAGHNARGIVLSPN